MLNFLGLEKNGHALVVGARSGLGEAFCKLWLELDPSLTIVATSRDAAWAEQSGGNERIDRAFMDITKEASVAALSEYLKQKSIQPCIVLNCSGALHGESYGPERTWRELEFETMKKVFEVNTFGVGLMIRYLLPLMPREKRSLFLSCSARVGSISDNRLGGWYSYRASKAAQNMLIKTASIEAKRLRKHLVCAAIHPGTVDTALSAPFTRRTPPQKLFSPEYSSEKLTDVMGRLSPSDTGGFFAWDGQKIEW